MRLRNHGVHMAVGFQRIQEHEDSKPGHGQRLAIGYQELADLASSFHYVLLLPRDLILIGGLVIFLDPPSGFLKIICAIISWLECIEFRKYVSWHVSKDGGSH